MAGSYEQLLKQQEIYKKQLEELEYQEYLEKVNDPEAKKRTEAYGRPLSLFLELLYKELYGIPLKGSNEDIVNRSGDALNRFYSIDPSFKPKSFSPDDLIVKETNKIVEVKKAIIKNNTGKDNYETITSYSSGDIKISILTGDEYRENLGDYYDGNQFNFVIDAYFLGEDEVLLKIINWYKETYETIGNNYYDETKIKQFTCGAEVIETFSTLRDIETFLTQYFLIQRNGFIFNNLISSARYKSRGGYQTNEEFVESILKPFLPESITQIKKINFIFSLETMNGVDQFSKKENFMERIQKIHKYFIVDEIEIVFLDLRIIPERNKRNIRNLHNNLKDYFFKIETKSVNKQVLKKPIKKAATKKFPKQIIVDPKKNKPIKRKTKATKKKRITKKKAIKHSNNKGVKTNNTNKQKDNVNVNYVDPIESINEIIGYNEEPLELDDRNLLFGISSNQEYLELKNEVMLEEDSMFNKGLFHTVNDAFTKDLEEYEPSLGSDFDQRLQDSQEKMRNDMLENKIINSINTDNYSKVNTMISILTERERETQREIDKIKGLIDPNHRSEDEWKMIKGEGMELQFELMRQKRELEASLLEYQQAINTLLPVLSTMNNKKDDFVKYNRANQDNLKKMRFKFEDSDLDSSINILKNMQSPLNGKPYEDGKYIYFNYKEFLKMKEIQEIIKYNRKKYKEGKK